MKEPVALPLEERNFLAWLRAVEKRAILPLKWAILFTTAIFWIVSHPGMNPPPVEVFALFIIFLMFNLGESYLLYFSKVSLRQVRPLCIASYVADIAFVTFLSLFEKRFSAHAGSQDTDFYILFFVLILRSFALFRTPRANLIANLLIGLLFSITLIVASWYLPAPGYVSLIRVTFIAMIIGMSWYIVRIITRQKDEIIRAREKLVQSENLVMVGELAAGVAHEINNPIGIITVTSEYLLKRHPESSEDHGDLVAIYDEARRCETIVRELLNYARPATGLNSSTSVVMVINEVIDFVQRRSYGHDHKVEFARRFPEQVPQLFLDPGHLKQALLNIYLNAAQVMKNGGVIRTDVTVDHQKNTLVVSIADNGPGITPDNLRRVFDPFFTTRAAGTGLGLSITRRIVETLGGDIRIRSKVDKGTTVIIQFPLEATVA